jgi:hypothetical protein
MSPFSHQILVETIGQVLDKYNTLLAEGQEVV